MSKRIAVITGIAGQDGSYLAELLLGKGYEVHGLVRPEAMESPDLAVPRLSSIRDEITLHGTSLEDFSAVFRLLNRLQPRELYHLAAKSFVSYRFDEGYSNLHANLATTHCLLSAITQACTTCRFYFAGSSEMFGEARSSPQDEETPFHPRSIYGISKVAGFHLVDNFRRSENLFAATGICYNHESPRRGDAFVTQKIARGVARIALGKTNYVELGNLDARRDWGHARDYVVAMWKMLQLESPEDFVIASGTTHTVRDFVTRAFAQVGLSAEKYVRVNPLYFREAEKVPLCGNPNKARKVLNWSSQTSLDSIVEEMVSGALQAEQLRS